MITRRERINTRLDDAAARVRAGEDVAQVAAEIGGPAEDVARLILARAGVRLRDRREWIAA